MTSYVPGGVPIAGFAAVTLEAIELRVISKMTAQMLALQSNSPQQDDLAQMRNDEAFGLGIVPPVVPG